MVRTPLAVSSRLAEPFVACASAAPIVAGPLIPEAWPESSSVMIGCAAPCEASGAMKNVLWAPLRPTPIVRLRSTVALRSTRGGCASVRFTPALLLDRSSARLDASDMCQLLSVRRYSPSANWPRVWLPPAGTNCPDTGVLFVDSAAARPWMVGWGVLAR